MSRYTAQLNWFDWTELQSEADFNNLYPEKVSAPKPWDKPETYPCLLKEIGVFDSSEEKETVVALCFEYNYKKVEDAITR